MDDTPLHADLVRALLREQHPDLADLDLGQATRGWDNEMRRLGPDLAVRLPRTPRAPDLLRKEHRWLPPLASRLPLPVPTPLRIGRPSDRFGQPWTVVTWVPGEPADRSPIRQRESADTLAGFLRALHRPAPAEAPVNPDRGVPLGSLSPGLDAWLDTDAAAGLVSSEVAERIREVWREAVAAPEAAGPPVWLHGDLHPANVVVADGALTGVLDFGELCAGDPATDLAAAWLLLPDGAAPRFLDAYGGVDEATVRRARGWAVRSALGLLMIGRAGDRGLLGGKPTWGPAGRAALDRVLTLPRAGSG